MYVPNHTAPYGNICSTHSTMWKCVFQTIVPCEKVCSDHRAPRRNVSSDYSITFRIAHCLSTLTLTLQWETCLPDNFILFNCEAEHVFTAGFTIIFESADLKARQKHTFPPILFPTPCCVGMFEFAVFQLPFEALCDELVCCCKPLEQNAIYKEDHFKKLTTIA